jgi:hypothetical protein
MKKKAKKAEKLRLSRETLQPLTSSDAQKVVGGDPCSMSPRCPPESEEHDCGTS